MDEAERKENEPIQNETDAGQTANEPIQNETDAEQTANDPAQNETDAVQTTNDPAQDATTETKRKKIRRKTLHRIIRISILVVVLAIVGWIVYSKLRAEYQVTYDPYTATTGTISNSLSFSGSLQLVNSASYSPTGDGAQKVKEVYVAVGDQVKKDQKLIRLSGETITAEFDGTVCAVECEKGDEVKSGTTLVTVADFDHMKVSIRVGESDINDVAVGQACHVTVSSVGAAFDSTISKIDYVSYTGNNVAYYTTTVNVDTAGVDNLYPGMQATVTITREEANDVTILKMDALSAAKDNTAYVWKMAEDGTMTESPVTVGVSNGNYVEIREGIEPGETIYKVAEKTETATGLSALFSGLFSQTRVNSGGPSSRNFGSGSGGSGSGMSGGFSRPSGSGSGGTRGN